MFKQYQPTPTPVKVYRASDVGAPQLKTETGSLKTLLKTCLVNGYGEGVNRKEPVGWKIADETANNAIFYSDDTYGIGLKVENGENIYVNAHMVGGEQFANAMHYQQKGYNNFSYSYDYSMKNWLIVACEKGFMLVLPQDQANSQILYFGRLVGFFEDSGNVVCVNTHYGSGSYWDTGDFGRKVQIVRSQWQDGGTAPLKAVDCDALSPFSGTSGLFPDPVFQNVTAAAITVTEKNQGSVRGTLPALFWCYQNLQGVVNDMDLVDMADGQQWIKLNISDSKTPEYCFVLNIQEWEI